MFDSCRGANNSNLDLTPRSGLNGRFIPNEEVCDIGEIAQEETTLEPEQP